MRGLSVVDQRTAAAKAYLATRRNLLEDVGGAEACSEAQLQLVEMVARGPRFVEFAEAIARARARAWMARATRISQAAKGGKILSKLSYTEPDGTVVEEVRYFESDWPADITRLEGCHPEPFSKGGGLEGRADSPPLNEEAT